jgi:hypothetical protein
MSRARLCQPRETLVPALLDLLARRPELRDVGIAGYLVGAAVEGAPGMPPGPLPCDCGCSPRALVRFGRSVAA